jgi:cysteine desulfurase / selenocysteine lyase
VSLTLQELLANEELRQHEFPVTRDTIFLAHAGVCPLPRRVAEAVSQYAIQSTRGDQEVLLPAFQLQKSRELAANLLGVDADEVAFVGPTSLALSFVASGLSFRRNENVLVYFDDYPSNVYPWMALADRGVEVRFLNIRELGRIRAIDVLGQVDEGTRLVALASCHFIAGFRIGLDEIGAALRKRGILFCVDGIQTIGAFPTPLANVDFLAADAHKWMLGPCAAGLLYVRQELQDRLRPKALGWNNVRCPDFVAQEDLVYRTGAKRYEAGSHNLLGLVGLVAAMELLQEIGVAHIAAELLRKRTWIIPALQAKGYTVLQASAPAEHASGIISFFKPGLDISGLLQQLEQARMVVSLRTDRSGQKYIRLSPHFYNTDAELQRVLELI